MEIISNWKSTIYFHNNQILSKKKQNKSITNGNNF